MDTLQTIIDITGVCSTILSFDAECIGSPLNILFAKKLSIYENFQLDTVDKGK